MLTRLASLKQTITNFRATLTSETPILSAALQDMATELDEIQIRDEYVDHYAIGQIEDSLYIVDRIMLKHNLSFKDWTAIRREIERVLALI